MNNMTFIIAIQLEDGVVVAVDNKNIQLKDKNINDFEEYDDVKLYGGMVVLSREQVKCMSLIKQ